MAEKYSVKDKVKVDKTLQKTVIKFAETKGQMLEVYKKLHKSASSLAQCFAKIGKNVFVGKTDIKETPKKQVTFDVCKDKSSPSSMLAKACKTEIANSTLRMELLESLRSTQAFENAAIALANKIDFTDRTFSALYPGGGSHIAPIVMAMLYMDADVIDTATFSYTEVNSVKLEQLEYILKNIGSVIPSLKYDQNDKKSYTCDNTTDGTETTLTVFYKGKPIHFRFLLSCSGESYFQPGELGGSKVFISHDSSGEDVYDNIEILEEYIQAAKIGKMKQKLPPIVMEDLSRGAKFLNSGPYVRFFDLEFLGKVRPITGSFGHRGHMSQPLKNLSPEQIKKLEDLKFDGDLETFTGEDLKKWKMAGSVPERHGDDKLNQSGEVGYPSYDGGVIFEINPAVLLMDKEQRTLIFETQIIASGNTVDKRRGSDGERFRLPPDSGMGLFNRYALLRIATKSSEMLAAVRAVNPAYEQVFAYRLAQSMMQLRGTILMAIERNIDIKDTLILAAQSLYKYLNPSQQAGLRAFVAQINAIHEDRLIFIKNSKRYKEWERKNPKSFFFDEEEVILFYKNHKGYKKFDKDMEKSISQFESDIEKVLRIHP